VPSKEGIDRTFGTGFSGCHAVAQKQAHGDKYYGKNHRQDIPVPRDKNR